MTTYNQATLKTFFETGDVPTGNDFANFIDSYVNIVDTQIQTMAGALSTTELTTARVSAGTVNVTQSLLLPGTVSAASIVAENISVSALNISNFAKFNVGIVSAAGTAQATGALLSFTINNGSGVVDGQTTGFRLPSNQSGRIQYIINGGASANLWPPTGGQINTLASNAAFAMTASTLYTIIHTAASGYAVK